MSGSNGMLAGTSLISFEQLCAETDPHFYSGRDHPWLYSFSNGRKFTQPLVATPVLLDPVPLSNALAFNSHALMFGDMQIEFRRNYTGPDAVDALAPFPDSTVEVFETALGFHDEPLNFGINQVQYRLNYGD